MHRRAVPCLIDLENGGEAIFGGATAPEWCGDLWTGGASLIGDIYRDFRAEIGAAPPPATCEFGNGLYRVGATLQRCTNGQMSLVRECANGCFSAPPGQDKRCN